jgi:hypothetical protein
MKSRINWSYPKGRRFPKQGNPNRKSKAKGLPYGHVPEVRLRVGPSDSWSRAATRELTEAAKGAAHDRAVTTRGKRVKAKKRWGEELPPWGGWKPLI